MPKSAFTLQAIGEGLIGAGFIVLAVLFSPLLRPLYKRWNATPEEFDRQLIGDERVPHPRLCTTRAVTIRAPAAVIWPWLIQIGYRRAGWYSYDALEALVGAAEFVDGQSSLRIIPEFQHVQPSDKIYIHPRIPGFNVAELEPGRVLVLHAISDTRTGKAFDPKGAFPEQYLNNSWVFYLETLDEKTTRLLVRTRLDYNSSFANTLIWRILTDPISFVMERKMLLGIKWRAESSERRLTPHKIPAGEPCRIPHA